ncbi:MAG TPA: DUF2231 domain-containing protein [Steroidobacteraceae bacterium]|nr:DUF2231 domain-containing protein [Steroidobacteraceae bacterium]
MRIAPHLHPLHPALAHFPLAFWIGSCASDLLALSSGVPVWWTVSHHATAAGLIMGALALAAGVLELWLRALPRAAVRWVVLHASLMSAALLLFMLSLSLRRASPPPLIAPAISLVGCALIIAGGFCGGTLVYRFGVGVSARGREP